VPLILKRSFIEQAKEETEGELANQDSIGACLILTFCSLLNLAPFNPDVTNFQGHSFTIYVSQPSSSLYHLLPPLRDTPVLSWLRTATWFTHPIRRTKNNVILSNML